jgi:hypothetical protein
VSGNNPGDRYGDIRPDRDRVRRLPLVAVRQPDREQLPQVGLEVVLPPVTYRAVAFLKREE